ncbi:MAG: ATP-dependent RNA helicase HrpA [Burkholderiales bacterium]|nr:ATP-dependent RNA helicase HrpA [Burkholderiales bacterium]
MKGQTAAQVERRRANLPRPSYPEDLPVVARRAEIARAIAEHPVIIVCGETGSGKTTQLPKICLELGRGVAGMIGHTQPRRIAARTVAARIASELDSPLGHAVGYKVRFADRVSPDTYVKVMTDGILLAETQGDRLLHRYDTIIIDEAHERSLNIDFLLGYAKELIAGGRNRRPDLKLIVTSATIDAGRFSRHFGGAPVIEVSGRLYPVAIRYRPLRGRPARALPRQDERGAHAARRVAPESGGQAPIDEDEDMIDAVLDATEDLVRLPGGGDVLVFLPGEREIRETADALRGRSLKGAEILPLYGRLSLEEQQRIFRPGDARRVVLATNVAETSLTVPGIRYVVDTGLARVNRYSYRNKVEQLLTEPVSRASADQRAGRCGRVAAGVCVRLYSEEDYRERPEYTDPEILRSSLAAVILRMKALGLTAVERFPFLDPPAPRMIADGYQLLAELGAVDEGNQLTPLGRRLARFPIDPRIARMILAAGEENCLAEILVIAAVLEVDDPRERPFGKAEAADRAHERFRDEQSDFVSLLRLWDWFDDAIRHRQSNRRLAQALSEAFLSQRRMREWRDVHRQLAALAGEMRMRVNEKPASYEQVHRALIAGLLGNIGTKGEEAGEYLGPRGIRFHIFPGSGLRRKQPRWVLAAELVETTRLYARCAARIEPEWIEAAAGALVKKHWFDPHWEKERAMVAAYERVTLYGLTLVPRRRVAYGPINPKEAREVLIRGALVAGEFDTRGAFLAHNQRLVKEVEALEHKTRRRDVLVGEEAIFAFYDGVVPEGIVNGADFEAWREQAERANPRLLLMTREYLMRHAALDVTEAQFPARVPAAGAQLSLSYRFEPGHPMDGVTATVPLHLLNQLEPREFEWLVPGLIREKVAALFKALPKAFRRHLTPPARHVTAFLAQSEGAGVEGGETLTKSILRYAQRAAGAPVPADALEGAGLPPHLLVNFRVIDEAGRELAMGRDLAALKTRLGQAAQLTFARAEPGIEKSGIRAWDFGELPPSIAFTRGGRKLTGYPALADEGGSVAIRLFDTAAAAGASMRAGVRRLMRLVLKEQMKGLEKNLPGLTQAALQLRALASPDELTGDLVSAVADRAFIGEDELPRNEKAFDALKQRARARLPAVREAGCRLVAVIAGEWQRTQQRLAAAQKALPQAVADIRSQVSRLVYKGFLSATPWERLNDLPRYLKAAQRRLDKYPNDPERDARHAGDVNAMWKRCEERAAKLARAGERDPRLEDFRWRIEELRVSLWAQELKTPYPVSFKRLDRLWREIAG